MVLELPSTSLRLRVTAEGCLLADGMGMVNLECGVTGICDAMPAKRARECVMVSIGFILGSVELIMVVQKRPTDRRKRAL